MNRAAMLMALADGPPVEFAASATTAAATATIAKPAGLEVGDMVIVWGLDYASAPTLTTTTGSAWAVLDTLAAGNSIVTSAIVAHWKVMTALDVSAAWTSNVAPGQGAVAFRYRGHGATTLAVKGSNGGTGNTNASLSVSGFTKAAGHYGAIFMLCASDQTGTGGAAPGFTIRADGPVNVTTRVAISDNTYGYVDGAAPTWSALNPAAPATNSEYVLLLEITGP